MACKPKSSATSAELQRRVSSPRHGNCTARHGKEQPGLSVEQPFLHCKTSYRARVIRRAHTSSRTSTCPQRGLFTRLPSGRRYRSVKSRATTLTNSFYPQGIRPPHQNPGTRPYTHSPPLPPAIFNLWHEARSTFKHSRL